MRINYTTPEGNGKRHFTIPYGNGPHGTPKTVGWLRNELSARYEERHEKTLNKKPKLTTGGDDGDELYSGDVLIHVLEPNQQVEMFQ